MLRQGIDDPEKRARFGAVYAILAFISVPVTFLSIRLLRTIHPVVVGGGSAEAEGGFSMTPAMRTTFFFSLIVFSVLFVDFLWRRIRLGQLAEKVEQLKLKITG
jgi:heme exporter protein C